jgi:C1A family cysteine protease
MMDLRPRRREGSGETIASLERRRAGWMAGAVSLVASVVAAIAFAPALAQTPPDPPGTSYGMGLLPASPDQIAHFPKAPELRAEGVPKKMDLSPYLPPVGDQKLQSSCTAWASGYALRSYYVAKMDKLNVSMPQNVPSPAYIYNHATGHYGNNGCVDLGVDVEHALDVLKGGVVSLAEMPYDATKCSPPPDVEMQSKATKFRIRAWQFIHPSRLDQIKAHIADGQPIVFGTKLAKSFEDFRGGGVYSRKEREPLLKKTHAMVLIGYDDDRKAFRLQNSWGPGWGDHGRAWLAYDTFYHAGPDGGDAIETYIIYAAPAFK